MITKAFVNIPKEIIVVQVGNLHLDAMSWLWKLEVSGLLTSDFFVLLPGDNSSRHYTVSGIFS